MHQHFPVCCMHLAGHTCISKPIPYYHVVCTSQAIHTSRTSFFISSSAMLYAPRRPYMHRQVRSVLSCYMRFSSHVRMTKSLSSLFSRYTLCELYLHPWAPQGLLYQAMVAVAISFVPYDCSSSSSLIRRQQFDLRWPGLPQW